MLKFATGLLLFSGTLYVLDRATDDMRHSGSRTRVERHAERVAERVGSRINHARDRHESPGDSVVEGRFDVAPGKRLDLDLKSGGAIQISGWNQEIVAAKAFLRGDDCDVMRVGLQQTPAGIEVRSRRAEERRHVDCDVRVEVRVPNRFDVTLGTMGGDVKIDDVHGEIRGKTMGGGLDLTRLKGRLNLTTMGGEVSLTKSDVDGEVKTMGGEMRLEDVVGDVMGSTMGGNVSYTRVARRAGSASARELVKISTMGGNIEVDEAPAGADVSTMGGSIRVRNAGGLVKAKTMGGSIEIGAASASVQATTMAGDINVSLVGHSKAADRDVRLDSKHGDITLTVPEDFSANVDIKLAFTRGNEGEYEIVSDFPLQRRETSQWDRSHGGDARRFVYGSGAIGAGRNTIRLETTNGNIYLKKAGRDR